MVSRFFAAAQDDKIAKDDKNNKEGTQDALQPDAEQFLIFKKWESKNDSMDTSLELELVKNQKVYIFYADAGKRSC